MHLNKGKGIQRQFYALSHVVLLLCPLLSEWLMNWQTRPLEKAMWAIRFEWKRDDAVKLEFSSVRQE